MSLWNNLPNRGVIIHHWDTDGLCSAALLLNYFAAQFPQIQLNAMTPTITNYYLTDEQYQQLRHHGYHFAITCDINFPPDTVQQLATTFPQQVYMFDHHHQTPYTEVHYFNRPHPACASFISEELGIGINLLAVIAMVGDREESIQQDQTFYPWVEQMMQQHGISFSQLLSIRRLIDSNYIMDDYDGINDTIELLRHDPLAILTDVNLESNLQHIGSEIDRVVEQSPQTWADHIRFFDIQTPLNILSHVTRHLSRQYPEKIIVTRQQKQQQVTCYVRRRHVAIDLRQLIEFARSLGLNSGGKEEVAGIIIPQARLPEIFPQLQQYITKLQV